MTLLARINLWLCISFAICLAAAVSISRSALREDARKDSIAEAQLMMESAQAARNYTSSEIEPLLTLLQTQARGRSSGEISQQFHPQTIPAYAATQIFDAVRTKRPEYTYREAMLNPTNLRDRATDWEADLISYFRADAHASELIRERSSELGRSLYLARPIRIDNPRCLACHDVPSAAPSAVLRQYGSVNGFSWKLNEVVGAQIVSVPLDKALSGANTALIIVVVSLTVLFVVMFTVVNLIIRAVVLKPIAKLASAADSISTGKPVDVVLNVKGSDEISRLCRDFDRMKKSIEKSIALLSRA